MTRDEALAFLAVNGLRGKDASTSLDAMQIRIGYGPKALDRAIVASREMETAELVGFYGMDGARAAILLSRA